MKMIGLIFLYWIWDVLLFVKEFCLWMNGDLFMMLIVLNINKIICLIYKFGIILVYVLLIIIKKVINKMNIKRDKLLGIVMVYFVVIIYLLLVFFLFLVNV